MKMKAPEYQHRVLDASIEELRKAMHICMDAVYETQYYLVSNDPLQMDVIENTNYMIDEMVKQMRQVIFLPTFYAKLQQHIKDKEAIRAITYAEIVARFQIDNLAPLSLAYDADTAPHVPDEYAHS